MQRNLQDSLGNTEWSDKTEFAIDLKTKSLKITRVLRVSPLIPFLSISLCFQEMSKTYEGKLIVIKVDVDEAEVGES